jgi:hypothetical protein
MPDDKLTPEEIARIAAEGDAPSPPRPMTNIEKARAAKALKALERDRAALEEAASEPARLAGLHNARPLEPSDEELEEVGVDASAAVIEAPAGPLVDETGEVRLHPILSNEDVLAIRALARKELDAERRKNAKAALLEQEKKRLQQEEGLVTADGVRNEMVRITLDLAEHQPFLAVNNTVYYPGFPYKVPRHVADQLREMQSRGWNHQNEVEGKGMRERFRRPYNTGLSPLAGTTGAPAYAKMAASMGAAQ